MISPIYITSDKSQEKFLRKKTEAVDFGVMDKKEREALVREMRRVMHEAHGIGLSANQIGFPYRVFVAETSSEKGTKFYAIFNPCIEKMDEEESFFEEGCLSVPNTYGEVPRPSKITLTGMDTRGKSVKIKAWGLLARIFQHEIDHLNGKLFVDRVPIKLKSIKKK